MRRGILTTLICFAVLALPTVVALAHPMGNFSISHYTAIRAKSNELRIRYRLDMAEIPTFQEMPSFDTNGDSEISAQEREAYLSHKVKELTQGQSLFINGQPAVMSVVASDLQVRSGAGDLPTLLITIDYRVPLEEQDRHQFEYADNNYPERTGWREIIAMSGDDWKLFDSNVPSDDLSRELTAYPTDPTAAPPQISRAQLTLSFQPSAFSLQPTSIVGTSNPKSKIQNPKSVDRFAQLITTRELSASVLLFSLFAAFALGAFHAMSPGHGKTVVAAYLVGAKGTARHAFLLGAVVTLTHTAGVFALGLIALFASKYILPEQLYPWLGFVSGMTIVGIGAWQFVKRYADLHGHGHLHGHHHHHHHKYHHHDGHDHTHGDHSTSDHSHHGHSHHVPDKITVGNLIALGVSGGLVPCPSALVVLLSAITLNRVGFGLVLILAFSLGLACVLIGIGLLMLYARRVVDRFQWEGGLLRRLPLFSSLVITILGLTIAMQALVSGGIVQVNLPGPDTGAALLMALGSGLASTLSSDTAIMTALGLGFVLGLQHALDPDHIVAVSTIVSENQSLARSSLIGAFWGVGHTTSLFLVGLLVIGLRLTIPDQVALSFEFLVAMMLIALGINVVWKSLRFEVHSHEHIHANNEPNQPHKHLHVHASGTHHHEEPHLLKHAKRPLLVGMIHGLAGSAALMLLVLTTIPSPWLGLAYIAIFGIGSIGGMLIMSSVIGLPFIWTAQRFGRINQGIKMTAGVFSVAFGLFLAWEIGFVEGLFR